MAYSHERVPMSEMRSEDEIDGFFSDDSTPRVKKSSDRSVCDRFSSSLASFCGLVDEEQEEEAKWRARFDELQTDKIIGQGKAKEAEDETDALSRPRLSAQTPIYINQASRRCSRERFRERKQAGFVSTAIEGWKDLVQNPKKSKRKPHAHSRSFAPSAYHEHGGRLGYRDQDDDVDIGFDRSPYQSRLGGMVLDDHFFSAPIGTSMLYQELRRRKRPVQDDGGQDESDGAMMDEDEADGGWGMQNLVPRGSWMVRKDRGVGVARRIGGEPLGFEAGFESPIDVPVKQRGYPRDRAFNQQIPENIGNANRTKENMGWFQKLTTEGILSRLFGYNLTKMPNTYKHRPMFTYWMTFVQVVIFIVTISVYGVAPIGFDVRVVSREIIQPNLALKLESYQVKENLWIGPRQADLIKLGAKFSPCMRKDTNVYAAIALDKVEENNTACCIYNDGSGCVQTKREGCSETLATWAKWTVQNPGVRDGGRKRVSGSVCGQDPKWCNNPRSQAPFVWADDITKWPICREPEKAYKSIDNRHMTCEIVGRPCCTGIQGECSITTREHCAFLHGHFHEEANLCSQVTCMADICGMLPFGKDDTPDQFYRLWTCLFLQAGLIHLVITIAFNLLVMLSIEYTIGWIRVVLIYMGSGVCGSLASAIFVPYHVEAGASGAQFGLLACQLVMVILYTENPWSASWKILLLLLVLLIIGLLPMVDNYAHVFGFFFGFLFSFAVLPFARFKRAGVSQKTGRLITLVVCTLLAFGLAAVLIVLFYVAPIYNCSACKYFNCVPITNTFCDTMEVNIRGVSSL